MTDSIKEMITAIQARCIVNWIAFYIAVGVL